MTEADLVETAASAILKAVPPTYSLTGIEAFLYARVALCSLGIPLSRLAQIVAANAAKKG